MATVFRKDHGTHHEKFVPSLGMSHFVTYVRVALAIIGVPMQDARNHGINLNIELEGQKLDQLDARNVRRLKNAGRFLPTSKAAKYTEMWICSG